MATMNPALRSFWKTKADVRVLKGGRSSSKTYDTCAYLVYLSSKYRIKILCVRQFQSKIAESVYANLCIQIERFGLSGDFEITNTYIRNIDTGSYFLFYGIARNITEIKGTEDVDILYIEEGEGLTKLQWEIIEPTVRNEGAEIILLYNPRLINDFVEVNFKHDPENGVIVRHINYDENPFLTNTMKRKIERLKAKDHEEYEHVYLGIARTDDDRAVIKRSWVEAAIDAHIKLGIEPAGSKRIGFDVADSGKDLCSQIYMHGIVALWGEHWKAREDELLQSCSRVYAKAIEYRADITYDSIGVGATAGSKFQEMNDIRKKEALGGKCGYSKFVAGAKVVSPDGFYISEIEEQVKNKDHFSNLKAQAWWLVADRFRNTYNAVVNGEKFPEDELISISSDMPNLDNLVTELSTPWRKFDIAGRVKVESKDDLAARDVDSPNDADAFIMANAPIDVGKIAMAW